MHAMEFWEITSKRAQQTLAVWSRHEPTLCIGTQGATELRRMISDMGPRVQARVAAQADFWEAFYHGQAALRDLKALGKRVARLLEGHLDDDTPLMQELHVVYQTAPRTEATILRRVRELLPVWERVNAALGPVTLMLRGRVLDVAAVRELLEDYTRAVQMIQAKAAVLRHCRAALRAHERATDRLNKRWYKVAKAGADEGTALAEALRGITTTAGGRTRTDAVIPLKPQESPVREAGMLRVPPLSPPPHPGPLPEAGGGFLRLSGAGRGRAGRGGGFWGGAGLLKGVLEANSGHDAA